MGQMALPLHAIFWAHIPSVSGSLIRQTTLHPEHQQQAESNSRVDYIWAGNNARFQSLVYAPGHPGMRSYDFGRAYPYGSRWVCHKQREVLFSNLRKVYALYDRKTWVFILFLFLVLSEFTAVAVGIALNPVNHSFVASSVVVSTPVSYAYFG